MLFIENFRESNVSTSVKQMWSLICNMRGLTVLEFSEAVPVNKNMKID